MQKSWLSRLTILGCVTLPTAYKLLSPQQILPIADDGDVWTNTPLMSRPAVVCHPTTCSPSLEANLDDCHVFSVSELSPKWSSLQLKTQPKSSARWFFWSCLLWCWVLHPKKDMILSMQHCCHQVHCLNFCSQSFLWINPNCNSIIAKPLSKPLCVLYMQVFLHVDHKENYNNITSYLMVGSLFLSLAILIAIDFCDCSLVVIWCI